MLSRGRARARVRRRSVGRRRRARRIYASYLPARHDTANDTHDDFIRSHHSTMQKVVICRVNKTTSASVVGPGSGLRRRRGSDGAARGPEAGWSQSCASDV